MKRVIIGSALAMLSTACSVDTTSKEGANADGKSATKAAEGKAAEGEAAASDTKAAPFAAPADVATPPADAKKTESGLAYKVLKDAQGDSPNPWDGVKVHYTGWTTDGEMFDSSLKRKRPAEFGLGQVIAGWTEGIPLMKVGSQYRFWIPQDLAYKGQHGKPPGMLVFDVELLDIVRKPAPPPAPDNVAAPPADATKTESGLAYKILKEADGEQPNPWDIVKVHYTGWTTDGKMFDSSRVRERPAEFSLKQVIKGWTEGIPLMKVGSQARFWIPVELAYKGAPGKPAGMLVFDVELLEVKRRPAPPPAPEDVAEPPPNAKKTKSGLAYRVLKKGKGKARARPWDKVKLDYKGWTSEGNFFESSEKSKRTEVGLFRSMEGWKEGIPLMAVGEKTRFWIPPELGFKGRRGRPQGMLVYDIELQGIIKMPDPPPTPKDVAAPPADAQKTASGLAYKVLTPGKGGEKPAATSRVSVNYTGWTTDGKMFDSSVVRGEPSSFGVRGVIKGWTEGLQLMTVGEKTRFWIPKELAYNDRPGKPAGMLVFDVELVEIDPKPKPRGKGKGGKFPPGFKGKGKGKGRLPAKSPH